MLFNSLDFAIFLPLVFLIYWFFKKETKIQNVILVIASYVFYGWWDWKFLSLILFSTIVDYSVGLLIFKTDKPSKKKILLWASLLINLGFLGYFKYFNFFIDSFVQTFSFFGKTIPIHSLNIILPVGISFYTFQTLSYTIDVYRNKLKPTKDFVAFAAFVSFFPQLVAGPIERATHLLPQFYDKRKFDYGLAVNGLRQILWGLFKKIVIADNCAEMANQIFNNSAEQPSGILIMGALFFTFQIYGDFSGYSDIAIGTSRLFGFDLMQNFNFPYFSRDIAEFWRRWHISLSTWFRDYLYIPLGGSKGGALSKIRNTFIVFLVSGFWHGANWTFVAWGFLNALYFLPLLLLDKNRANLDVVAKNRIFPTLQEFINIFVTFVLVVFAWIFFRANNLQHAFSYINGIFYKSFFSIPDLSLLGYKNVFTIAVLLLVFLLFEWHGRANKFAIETTGLTWKSPYRYVLYYAIIIAIFWFGGKEQQFIYFQF